MSPWVLMRMGGQECMALGLLYTHTPARNCAREHTCAHTCAPTRLSSLSTRRDRWSCLLAVSRYLSVNPGLLSSFWNQWKVASRPVCNLYTFVYSGIYSNWEQTLVCLFYFFFLKKKPDRKYTVKRNSYYSPGNENWFFSLRTCTHAHSQTG